ncbi:MAG: PAS domain S-box protein [Syntrophales bacterium]
MKNPELIEAEKYFLAIANTTEDMIHLNDFEGRIIYANKATEKILGYPLNELINTPASEIIHPDDRETIKKDMHKLSQDKQLPQRNIRLLKKDGSYIDAEVRGFIVALAENKYIGAIIRDISRRKRIENTDPCRQ